MHSLFKRTSYKQGTALAVTATLVWKTVSFFNALLLALYFGASHQTDIYFYLMLLAGFALGFLQRLNQTVLIPEAMALRKQKEETARAFITMWLYIYGVLGVLLSAVGFVGPEFIWNLLSRFGERQSVQYTWMLSCSVLLLALQMITYYLTAVAEMYKFFRTSWLCVLNALCPLAFLLILGRQIGIISMVYGFLVAQGIQIGLLIALLKIELHWTFAWAWVPLRVRTRQNMLTGQTLAIVDIVNSTLPVYLLSGMGAGLVSALNYSKQFADSATEVFTARASNIAKIQMTEQAVKQDTQAFNQTFLLSAYGLLALLAPLAVFSCYFAPQIVEVFFKRGHFDMHAVNDTVSFLRPMLFVILLMVPGFLQNSVLSAGRKIKEGFPYALVSGLICTGLYAYAMPRWGAFSYPYLMGAGLLIGFILNAFLFKKHFPTLPYAAQLGLVLRLTFLAGLALLPVLGLSVGLPKNCWLQLAVCGPLFVATYLAILYATRDLQKLVQLARNGF